MSQTIETKKQLDSIACDELNIKELWHKVAETDKGVLCVVYNREKHAYSLNLGGATIENKKVLDMLVEKKLYENRNPIQGSSEG